MHNLGLAATIAMLVSAFQQLPNAPATDWSGYWFGTVQTPSAKPAYRAVPVFYRLEQKGDVLRVYPACEPSETLATLELSKADQAYFKLAQGGEVVAKARLGKRQIELTPLLSTKSGALSSSAETLPFTLRPIDKPKCSLIKTRNGTDESVVPVQTVQFQPSADAPEASDTLRTSAFYSDPCAPGAATASGSICTNLALAKHNLFPIGSPTLPTPTGAGSACADQATSVQCLSTPMTQTAVADLSNQLAFAESTYLYPGSILKGGSYINGNLDPVRLPRTGGTLSFSGLIFGGSTPTYQVSVNDTTNGSVTQAINQVLAQPITGTTAVLSSSFEQVSDQHSLDVALGVTVNYGGRYFDEFKFNKNTSRNVYVAKFTQNYYVVGYDIARPPASLFAQGPTDTFNDAQGDLADNNAPPVIVDQVTYGVQYILFIESQYSKTAVQNTLNAALGGVSGNALIDVNSTLTYNDVASSATAYYIAFGGSSTVARTPLSEIPNARDPQSGVTGLFGGFGKLLTDLSNAQASPTNPGAPIAFSMKYLSSGNSASIAYTTSFIQKNCTLTPANAGLYTVDVLAVDTQSSFVSFAARVDNQPDVTFDIDSPMLNLQLNQAHTADTELETGPGIPLRGTHTVHFTLTHAAFNYALMFDLMQDGSTVLSADASCLRFFCPVRKVMTLDVDINRVIKSVAVRKFKTSSKGRVTPKPKAPIPSCPL